MFDGRMGLAAALFATALLAGCGSREEGRPAEGHARVEGEPAAQGAPPTFRIAVLTDPKGYLAPCGCTSRPLGGIDRMAAFVRGLEAGGAEVALVAAGSLFLDGVDRGPDGMEPDRWRAETMIEVWNGLGLDAATPGALDFTYGASVLRALGANARFPLLAANARVEAGESGRPALGARTLLTLGGTKVALVGVADLGAAAARAEGVVLADDPIASAREAVAAARAEGADMVLVLASGDRAFANRVAGAPGVDFVVRGGIDHEPALPPASRGDAHLLHAGRQGQGVLVLDVYRRGPGRFVDASPWTGRAATEQLEGEARELEARIAAWSRDSTVRPEDLAEQRSRLAGMRAEVARAGRVALPESGNAFVAAWHELPPEAPRDRSIAASLEGFDRRVNDRNHEVFASVMPPSAPPGEASYVGSAACSSCHAAAYAWWQGHPHGRAYPTLVDRHKEFHLDCVGCHVTGYNRPGGSNVTHNLDGALVNVGCESCHGPGSLHVANPTETPRTVVRATPEATCVSCHNDEHSDLFDFDTYRRRLLAPGHGAGAGS